MKPRPKPRRSQSAAVARRPAPAAGPGTVYTVGIVAQLAGLSSRTVVRYLEQGLISPRASPRPGAVEFDEEALRLLRRIEHLRTHYRMTPQGLKLTLRLLEELERLQDLLRSRH